MKQMWLIYLLRFETAAAGENKAYSENNNDMMRRLNELSMKKQEADSDLIKARKEQGQLQKVIDRVSCYGKQWSK